jgi:outer membrane protein OmpA-like peptidoglycan-associated protein
MQAGGFHRSNRYTVTIREDYSVRTDGAYKGFLSREIHGSFFRSEASYPPQYEGVYFGTGALRREQTYQAVPLEINYRTVFTIDDSGEMRIRSGALPPVRMNIPCFPKDDEDQVSTWSAPAQDSLFWEGKQIPVPTMVTYRITGNRSYEERPVMAINYEYSLRLKPYQISGMQDVTSLHELFGTVKGEMLLYLDQEGGLFSKERIIRRTVADDGTTSDEEGFRLIWYTGVDGASLNRMIADLSEGNTAVHEAGSDGSDRDDDTSILVEERSEGVVLTLPNIHFKPDEAEILPQEVSRLDELARVLSQIRDTSFLVVGHTADVGTKESQKELSVDRARRIISELSQRGLDESRFLYDGVGGTQPVASNDNEEGRKKNRRVEIFLLE